jgi:hypothetical protein
MTLLGVLGVGIPVRWLLGRCRPMTEQGWVEVPFVGISAVILLLHTPVYFDVPVRFLMPVVWLLTLVAWVVIWRKGQLKNIWRGFPRGVFAACLGVYVLNGLALFAVGARAYAARGYPDQFHYSTLAQFLHDLPFSIDATAVEHRPYLFHVVDLKNDRIGQSLLHAFFIGSTGTTAKTMFEPVILLSPVLVAFAVYALARRLGLKGRRALGAAFAAGLMPAMAQIHLESFLSQALGTSFLVMVPTVLAEVETRRRLEAVAAAALIVATGVTVYTEFFLFFEGMVLAFLLLSLLGRDRSWRLAGGYLVVACSPLLFNPCYGPVILRVLHRLQARGFEILYPWATQPEGLVRLWFGDLVNKPWPRLMPILNACGLAATVAGGYGLINSCFKLWLAPAPGRSAPPAFCAVLLALVFCPLLVLALDQKLTYQFYKLALTVSPFLVLGISSLGVTSGVGHPGSVVKGERWFRRWLVTPALVLLFLGVICASLDMVLATRTREPLPRSNAWAMRDTSFLLLEQQLQQVRGKDILYCTRDGVNGSFQDWWIGYFARYNRAWSANYYFQTRAARHRAAAMRDLADPRTCPKNCLFLSRTNSAFFVPAEGFERHHVEWRAGDFVLWSPADDDWVLLTGLGVPGDRVQFEPPLFWLGGPEPADLRLLSGRDGTVVLRAQFRPGPSRPEGQHWTVEVRHEATGWCSRQAVNQGVQEISVPVCAGVNRYDVRVLDAPSLGKQPSGDDRPMVLGVGGPQVRLVPIRSAPRGGPAGCSSKPEGDLLQAGGAAVQGSLPQSISSGGIASSGSRPASATPTVLDPVAFTVMPTTSWRR